LSRALKKKLEAERKERASLEDSISREQHYLQETLKSRLSQVREEREWLMREVESEEGERVAAL
jgi:uncharacterized membrane protein YcaP (DUF421 family)